MIIKENNITQRLETSSEDTDLIRRLLSENPSLNQTLPPQVLSLIRELLEKVERLESEIEALRKENSELKRHLDMNSSNSSKPPSSDPPSMKYPARTPTGRKPGKQKGAKGHRRHFLTPTTIVDHRPEICQHCGFAISNDVPVTGDYQRWQQVEIPPIEPIVIERRYHAVRCPNCRKVIRAKAKGEERACYGTQLGALIAIFATVNNLSRRQIGGLLSMVLGIHLSLGTIDNSIHEAGNAAANPVKSLREELAQQDRLNIDETGWKKAGEKRWLWTFVAPAITFFHIAETRGKKVLQEILGERFDGIIGSDRHKAYQSYEKGGWQVCLAHLIREAKGLSQSPDRNTARFGFWVRRELKLMIKLRKRGDAKSLEMNSCKARLKRACYLHQNSPDKQTRRFARGILRDWEAVTLFTRVEGIPPTNNIAERSLRQLVISRKISFGSHSEKGMVTTQRLRTIIATARMRGIDAWDYLAHALTQHRAGKPVPLLQTSLSW